MTEPSQKDGVDDDIRITFSEDRSDIEPADIIDIWYRLRELPGSALRETATSIDWSSVAGPGDYWFNVASYLAQRDVDVVARQVYKIGTTLHPEHVDLLCGRLNIELIIFEDMNSAKELWGRLKNCPNNRSFWRYWTTGASYLAKTDEYVEAISHLREGLTHVPARELSHIYNLTEAMVGWVNGEKEAHETAFREALSLLREGLDRGLPQGHSLALTLAQMKLARATGSKEKRSQMLNDALEDIETSETLFVSNANFRITPMLLTKARILISLKRHSEALPLLRAIEACPAESRRKVDRDAVVELRVLCEQILGEKSPELELETAAQALSKAVQTGGPGTLLSVVKNHPELLSSFAQFLMVSRSE